jgi:hypothetical protein
VLDHYFRKPNFDMRSTGAYYLHLPLHEDVIPVTKDLIIIEELALADPDIYSFINVENQPDSGTLRIITTSTPSTDPFLLTLRHVVNKPDEVKRKNLTTALE